MSITKKIIKYITFMIMVSTLLGCANQASEENETKDTEQAKQEEPAEVNIYDSCLQKCYQILISDSDMLEEEDFLGVAETAMYYEKEEALEKIGYSIRDISGDDVPELLIGWIDEQDDTGSYGNIIYTVYSIVDGQPTCVLEGWARNAYYWLGEGRFLNVGSGGAAYSIFGTYHLAEDGSELICEDYYFTHEKDENFEKIGAFHNNTGEWGIEYAEELEISMEEFWNIEQELEAGVQMMKLTPFSEFEE